MSYSGWKFEDFLARRLARLVVWMLDYISDRAVQQFRLASSTLYHHVRCLDQEILLRLNAIRSGNAVFYNVEWRNFGDFDKRKYFTLAKRQSGKQWKSMSMLEKRDVMLAVIESDLPLVAVPSREILLQPGKPRRFDIIGPCRNTLVLRCRPPRRFAVGNTHRLLPEASQNMHRWSCYVHPYIPYKFRAGTFPHPSRMMSLWIREVTFMLHPTFSPASVTVTRPPYKVERQGWGVFRIDIRIVYRCGCAETFQHMLNFEIPRTEAVVACSRVIHNDCVCSKWPWGQ